jgi:hypothetical protein
MLKNCAEKFPGSDEIQSRELGRRGKSIQTHPFSIALNYIQKYS